LLWCRIWLRVGLSCDLACEYHPLEEGHHDFGIPVIGVFDGVEFILFLAVGSHGSFHEFWCHGVKVFEMCHPLEE